MALFCGKGRTLGSRCFYFQELQGSVSKSLLISVFPSVVPKRGFSGDTVLPLLLVCLFVTCCGRGSAGLIGNNPSAVTTMVHCGFSLSFRGTCLPFYLCDWLCLSVRCNLFTITPKLCICLHSTFPPKVRLKNTAQIGSLFSIIAHFSVCCLSESPRVRPYCLCLAVCSALKGRSGQITCEKPNKWPKDVVPMIYKGKYSLWNDSLKIQTILSIMPVKLWPQHIQTHPGNLTPVWEKRLSSGVCLVDILCSDIRSRGRHNNVLLWWCSAFAWFWTTLTTGPFLPEDGPSVFETQEYILLVLAAGEYSEILFVRV